MVMNLSYSTSTFYVYTLNILILMQRQAISITISDTATNIDTQKSNAHIGTEKPRTKCVLRCQVVNARIQ